jgi:glycosyltransferase involved in cell wall biosynthesis
VSHYQHPLVAIVTPVYNGEKYLAETMACVQALDYPKLVHIVLDNASSDATPHIISRYLNGRVPVLVSRNPSTIPIVANFNASLGLVPSEASYFRLLCADDLMAPDAITRKVELAERHPEVDIVGCLERSDELREEDIPKDREVFDGRAIAGAYLRGESSVLSGTHFLFRRRQLEQCSRFYDEKFESFCDADANLRVCIGGQFGFIHEGLATWRRHDSNAWNRHAELCISTVEWLQILRRYASTVLEPEVCRERLTAYRRHCLRRLLLLRWRAGDKTTFARHLDSLRRDGDPVGWLDFADALVDWAQLALTGRRHLVGVARSSASAPG